MKKITYLGFLLVLLSLRGLAQDRSELSVYHNERELTAGSGITLKPGFVVPAGAKVRIYIGTDGSPALATQIDGSMNTIVTYTPKVAGLAEPRDRSNSVSQVNVEVQTLDHFGRVKEVEQLKVTPAFNTLVQLHEYDGAQREVRKFLPYAQAGNLPAFYSKGYSSVQGAFYSSLGSAYATPSNSYPVSESKYDDSPLNLLRATSSPGASWSLDSGRTVRISQVSSPNDILRYKVIGNNLVVDNETNNHAFDKYSGLQLSCVRTEDENVARHAFYPTGFLYPPLMTNGSSYEYKNYKDLVILKRQLKYRDELNYEYLSTYYVYDDKDNLRMVLPPLTNADAAKPTAAMIDNLCYQYKYDNSKRLIEKKLPGKGWEYIVYNRLDQVVMSQDSVQRGKTPQEWNIVKYDALGRTALSGIYTQPESSAGTNYRATIQASVDAETIDHEDRAATINGYSANTFPTSNYTTLSLNYYDDYDLPGGNPYLYSGSEVSTMTRGLATASLTGVLGTTNMLWTVSYYDEDGRNVKTFKQHYKGGTISAGNYDELSSTYDFTGKLLTSTRSHKISNTEQLKTLNEYDYDPQGRKINSWETINNTGTRTLLSQNQYDELGNLFKKKLHSTDGGSTFLQTITYTYNERGWLTRAQADKFDLKLRYNQPAKGGRAQYNGNIAEQEYTGSNSGNHWFKYYYDVYNRLDTAMYDLSGNNANNLSEIITYDKNGNISTLNRNSAGVSTYTYTNSGLSNQLSSTSGPIIGSYSYDGNGNALSDTRRGVTLTYNQLNLPKTITGNGNASYTYDASGTKLNSTQNGTTREYIAGIQYTNGAIDFIQTEEGRAVRNQSDSVYRYEYNLKDHLGNVRVSIDQYNSSVRVIQEDEYYAFGLDKPWVFSGDKNNSLYNGKEKQDVLTDEYDYGARFYDPVIGRWTSVDLSAEKTNSVTPYHYGNNNPVLNIDGDGRYAVSVHYNITYRNMIALGYSTKEADRMAHYASTYADHPTHGILQADTYFHTGMIGVLNDYRKGIDYSKTAASQDEANSTWHSMMSNAEADAGMTESQATTRGLRFGWDNIFASDGGKDLGKLGQGIHALQDAIAHGGVSTREHLFGGLFDFGDNISSMGKFANDLYGSTQDADNLTRTAGILTRLMGGQEVKYKKNEELHFKGMSGSQVDKSVKLLINSGFRGTINFQ
jgi:RHS repeat-associated protein